MNRMDTPRTRAEFERVNQLLHRQISDGKFHIPHGATDLIEGIARVRYLPNGRIDFLSIDETTRLQANMLANMMDGAFGKMSDDDQESAEDSIDLKEGDQPPDGSSD